MARAERMLIICGSVNTTTTTRFHLVVGVELTISQST